jgi:hypothetical protein
LLALIGELASENNPEGNRQLAGLFVKNMISAQVCFYLPSLTSSKFFIRTNQSFKPKDSVGMNAMRISRKKLEQG